jgi:hypothetical protein
MSIARTQGSQNGVSNGSAVLFDTVLVGHGGSDITFTGTTGSPSSNIVLAPGNMYWVNYQVHIKPSSGTQNISVSLAKNSSGINGSMSTWDSVSNLINPGMSIIVDTTGDTDPVTLTLICSQSTIDFVLDNSALPAVVNIMKIST